MKFDNFEVLTFDCYGTLVDWETGLLEALSPVLVRHQVDMLSEKVLGLFGELEAVVEAGEFRSYRKVLENVLERMGTRLGFVPSQDELSQFCQSVGDWRPFPDTVQALQAFKKRFRLGIVSNVDDDLFEKTAQHLHVAFDWIVTAQQTKSYKPSLNNFRQALNRIGFPKSKILHVAQSLYHDIVPAKALGISTVWVNRRLGQEGFGATVPAQGYPDLEVPNLMTLAEIMEVLPLKEESPP